MKNLLSDSQERYDISHLHNETLFVEAGAGTGKTSSLVSRAIELLRAGTAIENMAIITFTEAAAAELRDRVRLELEGSSPTPEIEAALAGLDAAAISTLHGFAKRILTENLLEAGLPPAIEVLSEIRDELDFQAEWQSFLTNWLNNPTKQALIERSMAVGVTTNNLQALAKMLRDEWDRLPPTPTAAAPLIKLELENIVAQVRELVSYQRHCTVDSDTMLTRLKEFDLWLSTAPLATTDAEFFDVLGNLPSPRVGNIGRAGNWTAGKLTEIRESARNIEAAVEAVRAEVSHNLLSLLLEDLRVFTLECVSRRKTAGQLRFHDLLVIAAQELRGNAELRSKLHRRYRHLIIDEFQDTDPIQIEIARLITTAVEDPTALPWSELDSPPGSLFFVGDPKQAIYRFRRADISLFMQVANSRDTTQKTLSTNFRTVPGIIEWVNHIFTGVMGTGTSGIQPHYVPLEPGRQAPKAADVPVVVLGGPLEEKKAPQRRQVAYRQLASALHGAMAEQWPVVDRHTGLERLPRWSDIAVLVPVRTGLEILRQVFDDAGIPYRIEAVSLVWRTSEVRDLLNILHAISDRTNTVALTAALRSDSLACSDNDLAVFVARGGIISLAAPQTQLYDDPVSQALSSLERLASEIMWDEPSAAIERVISRCHLRELATNSKRPRDVWRRLRFVVDQARLFADTESVSLRDFLAWADLQAAEASRQSEMVLPETDDDAIRVLTIHASKGLEFPIVALAGLDRTIARGPTGLSMLWNEPNGIEAQINKNTQTKGFSDLATIEKEHEAAEQWRLMYVATTRARDHLILDLHHQAHVKKETVAKVLYDRCEKQPNLWRRFTPKADQTFTPAKTPTPALSSTLMLRSQWQHSRKELRERNAKPSVMVPSNIAKVDGGNTMLPTTEVEPWRRGRAGTNIGRAVHATLQLLDFNQPANLANIAKGQAEVENVAEIADQVESAVRSALDAPSLQKAKDGPHWRELYLASTIDGVLCEGYIDLLVENERGFEVIDYKTDAVDNASELVERYRLQAATYALLVEATLHKPTTRCVFILIKPDRHEEIEIPDLESAKADVRQILATNARRVGEAL